MKNSLEDILTGHLRKDDMLVFMKENPDQFANALNIALSDDKNLGWRAAWIIHTIMYKNDSRIKKHIGKLIKSIKNKNDGHQRELLRILMKMEIDEDNEGYLLDQCIFIWGNINKSSSVRIISFRIITGLLKKYPELHDEVLPLTQKNYYENLSG
jgi:hypothetical protein